MLPSLLWYFLPSQLTHILLPYLATYLPAYFPASQRNSPTYRRNYRNVYTALVLGYLAYTFVQEESSWGEDYYAVLGVGRAEGDEGLRRAFRTLYHPDRARDLGPGAEAIFIHVRQAYEVLTDPVKRYAYDRFGPDITNWRNVASVKEYMYAGLFHSLTFYAFSGGIMLLLSITGRATAGSYWRYTLFILLLTLELTLLLSPTPPGHLSPLFSSVSPILPSRIINTPQFIWVRTLHRIWTSLSVAVSQLAGVWQDSTPNKEELNARIAGMVRSLEAEVIGAFHAEVVPVLSKTNDPLGAQETLLGHIEQLMLDQSVSSHPVVRDALQSALSRSAPATNKAEMISGNSVLDKEQGKNAYRSIIEVARSIPLPPSPPPSPPMRHRVLR